MKNFSNTDAAALYNQSANIVEKHMDGHRKPQYLVFPCLDTDKFYNQQKLPATEQDILLGQITNSLKSKFRSKIRVCCRSEELFQKKLRKKVSNQFDDGEIIAIKINPDKATKIEELNGWKFTASFNKKEAA